MALTQSHYRFGIDSGTESTHGWHANEDTNPSPGTIALDTTFLLRFCVQANATGLSNVDNEFQFRRNGGTWTNITTTSSFVRAVAATALTNGSDCTKRLSGTGTFESSGAGQTEDGTSGGTANDIVASGNSETECGLQLRSADLVGGDVVEFRLTRDGGTLLDTYAVTPSITIPAAAVNIDPSLIAATTSVPSPFVDPALLGSLIASTASVPSPAIVLLVDPGRIESTASVPSPTIDPTIDVTRIESTTSVPSAFVDVTLDAPAIAATTSVPAPTIDTGTNVDAERIESTASVPSPAADPSLLAVFLAAASVVFAPVLDQALGAPRIESTTSVPSPALDVALEASRVEATTSVPGPAIEALVAPTRIEAATSVPSPTIDPTIDVTRIESTASVPSPYVGTGSSGGAAQQRSGGFFGMGW